MRCHHKAYLYIQTYFNGSFSALVVSHISNPIISRLLFCALQTVIITYSCSFNLTCFFLCLSVCLLPHILLYVISFSFYLFSNPLYLRFKSELLLALNHRASGYGIWVEPVIQAGRYVLISTHLVIPCLYLRKQFQVT